ncbi:MAG: HAMP domain-containing sensor histidine kinase [Clostridia bacterium]|nr:HAMP domain-containing sensor histidine kinase [Clostridia bacterium]
MKKLKNKVFCVLFFILTLFLLTILLIFNYQDYNREKNDIRNHLMRMDSNIIKPGNLPEFGEMEEKEQKIFMDLEVYTVLLDQNNSVIEVINHSEEGLSDNEVQKIAENIITNQKLKSLSVGNLYFDDYSFSFKKNHSLVIIDNQKTQERLISLLQSSIIIFILLEIVILYVSLKLTSWMIKPVLETFEKQKQFITDASHELKTPLSVIMASADALGNDPSEKKWLNNIKSESERMNRLISSLLNLARVENGVTKDECSEINLSKLIEMSVLTFEGMIYEKNIELEYKIEGNLNLTCNPDQIKQLMAILIDNAIKHSEKKGKIKVSLKKERNSYIVEVANKGKAIPKGEEKRIFERFYRVDEARNRNDNRYGLGLAIANNIVLNHNGEISAKSEGDYTTFKVEFKMV